MSVKNFIVDARWLQLGFQLLFMSYGLLWLGWTAEWEHYLFSILGALTFNYLAESIRGGKRPALGAWPSWGLSALVSAMSLCLLLKTGHWYTSLLAASLTIASKYIIRIRRTHIFNPSAFGIVATLMISKDAWLSPGQWGSDILLFFFVIVLGAIVVTRVQKLDTSLSFLLTFICLTWWRQAAAPVVPVLDRLFKARSFQWASNRQPPEPVVYRRAGNRMKLRKAAAILILLTMAGHDVAAFCGFYVSKADGTPIRLGMANADGDQDLIVYAFSKAGRIECANYLTVSLPTGKNIPLFIQNNFSTFYSNLFQHQWKIKGKSVAIVEYAWDVGPGNNLKCDPCVAAAPTREDMAQAGVWWLGDRPEISRPGTLSLIPPPGT